MPPPSLHPVLHHLQRFLAGRKVRGNVLVAVSGGPDSVCMLHALVQSYDKSLIHVGHFNHHLRGEASEADAVYVRELCGQLGVRFHLGETTQLQPAQKGIEAQARQLRYQWLSEVAEREQCMRVMTGHTMNDQAETVLHHLIRGTGWRGLRGIAPSRLLPSPSRGEGPGVRGSSIELNPIEEQGLPRSTSPSPLTPLPSGERGTGQAGVPRSVSPSPLPPLPGGERGTGPAGVPRSVSPSPLTPLPSGERGTGQADLPRSVSPSPLTPLPGGERGTRLLRPLLACTREQVLDYLITNDLSPRYDASNEDVRFTRNRIRHQVLPQLVEMNSDAVKHLASWATTARRHYASIQQTIRTFYRSAIMHQTKDHVALHRKNLAAINDEVLQELLRHVWLKQGWAVDQMNTARWHEVNEVCRGVRTAVELPGRIMVRRKDLVIQFIKQ